MGVLKCRRGSIYLEELLELVVGKSEGVEYGDGDVGLCDRSQVLCLVHFPLTDQVFHCLHTSISNLTE